MSNTTSMSSLKVKFTYPGWRNDFLAVHGLELYSLSARDDCLDRMNGMINKQRLFDGDRSQSQIVKLDLLSKILSYRGWEDDVKAAETVHSRFPSRFEDEITHMIKKQRLLGEEAKSKSFDEKQYTQSTIGISTTDDRTSCVICLGGKSEFAFIPCGHLCICKDCAICVANFDSRCPTRQRCSYFNLHMINLGTPAHRKRSIVMTICPDCNRQTRCNRIQHPHPDPTPY